MLDTDRKNQPNAVLVQAHQAYDAMRLDEALALYRQVAEDHPSSYEAQVGLARTLTRMRRQDEAKEAIDRAIALAPERYEGYAAAGVLHFLLDETEDALRTLDEATQRAPAEPEPHITMAQVHSDAKRFDEADQALEHARTLIDALPEGPRKQQLDALALHAKTYRYLSSGDTASAMETAQQVVALEAANPYAACLALSNMGILEARAKHYDQAIEYLERAFAMNPYFGRAGSALGRLLLVRGSNERAEEVLATTLAHMPEDDAGTRYAHALSLARLRRRADAQEEYRRALSLGLSGVNALLARWQVLWQSDWGRYIVVGVLLAAVLVWIILAQPSAQTLTLVGLLALILILQRTVGRRKR